MPAAGADRAAVVAEEDQHAGFVGLQGEEAAGQEGGKAEGQEAGKSEGRPSPNRQEGQGDARQNDGDDNLQHFPAAFRGDLFFAVHRTSLPV